MAQSFSVNVYGTVAQQPPYNGNTTPLQAAFSSENVELGNFSAAGTNAFAAVPGFQINGVYCYGVIEVPPSGLQQYSTKYVVKETVATIATLKG